MQFTKQTNVSVPADKVWEILGTNFNDISEWASFVLESQAIPDLPEGSGRICQVKGLGETVEKLEIYDDQEREFTFTMENDKLPFFMRRIANTWHVKPHGDNQAQVSVTANITILPVFAQLLASRLRQGLSKTADSLLSELKYFAENDRPLVHA